MIRFFSGLRGKLILTYTMVTVLALLALELIALLAIIGLSNLYRADLRSYLGDVISTLYPQARNYLQPGAQNLEGLQDWLDQVSETGLASLPPQDFFDSPAAVIVKGEPILVLDHDSTVVAMSPHDGSSLIGRKYNAANDPAAQNMLENALAGNINPLAVSYKTPQGNYRIAVPVFQTSSNTPVVGVILVTVAPVPSMVQNTWPVLIIIVLVTGVTLLLAVAPFGALFGMVMSRGLTRRLEALASAADAWADGNFHAMPVDRSSDEIGMLSRRLQAMAERIQNLLQTQQELAVLEERHRLARDLHDTVKQQSFATLMQVRAAHNLLESNPEAAGERLAAAEELLKSSQQELGLLIAELRPAALEGQGLTFALRAYLKAWSDQTRIPAELQVSSDRRLQLELEQTLYRVAQEALANVARHSRASAVTMQVAFKEHAVYLVIADNGVGFSPGEGSGGFGLKSMQDRISEFGGHLEIASTPEQGTRITARVPIPEGKDNGKRKN